MNKNKRQQKQPFLPNIFSEELPELVSTGITLPLEVDSLPVYDNQERPELPARWEATQLLAQRRNALPVVLRQIRPVPAIEYLSYLLGLSRDEGYVWVVYGASGCGKSTFFHTLQYQTNNGVSTHIIDARKTNLSDQASFSTYLENVISTHKVQKGEDIPLVVVLEERENEMNTEERSSIVQSLKNLKTPQKR